MVTEIRESVIPPVVGNGNGGSVSLPDALPSFESGWSLRPLQIVSLYEMIEFHALPFYDMTHKLRTYMMELEGEIKKRGESDKLTSTEAAHFQENLQRIEMFCAGYSLAKTYNNFAPLLRANINALSLSHALLHMQSLDRAFGMELAETVFMYVPSDKAQYLENWTSNPKSGALFDDPDVALPKRVSQKFPEASQDISMAGNCLGIEANTACVFHLMRVAEYGLRYLARILKVRISNKGKFVPIEEGTWNDLITACENKIDAIRKKPMGPKRREQLALYSDAGQHCLFMKDIWRNSMSHAQQPYIASEAKAAFERVCDFMKFLAVNVS